MSGRLGSRFLLLVAWLVLGAGCGVAGPSPAVTPSPSAGTSTASGPTMTPSTAPATVTPPPSPPSVTPPAPATSRPTTSRPSATPRPSTTRPSTTQPTPGCRLPAGLLGKDLEVLPGSARVVALTFDAGGSDKGLSSILGTLAREKAPASFFLTGRFALAFPQQSRAIARSYPVGNHSQTHPDLTRLPAATVKSEIRTAATNIRTVTGVDPRPYFRFPFGARDAATITLVNAECYVPFRWTVDTLGWKGTSGGMSADKVYQRVVSGLRPGAVILMHVGANPDDGTTLDADALPRIIQRIRADGYTLVTLEAALPAAP